jgi:hypothetical protein
MKRVFTVLAAAWLMCGSAHAADFGHSGTWRYVAEGSYWSTGDLPKEFSLLIDMKFSGGQVTYSSVNDTDKSKIGKLAFVAPLDGSIVPIENQARYNQVSVKVTGPNELAILQLKDGDVIVGSFYTFAANGKTFVRRGVGKSPEGKSKAYEEYFKRQ